MTTLSALLGSSGSDGAGAGAVLFVIALYFVPTIVAVARKLPNVGSVIVINLLLGWTVVGWIVALAMALGSGTSNNVTVSNMIHNNVGAPTTFAPPGSHRPTHHDLPADIRTNQWAADPFRRNQLRYFDGAEWTDNVSNGASQVQSDRAEYPPPVNGDGKSLATWAVDPFGRHAHRYFDGTRWTETVASVSGSTSIDSPNFPAPEQDPVVPPPPVVSYN